ncbi:unnamed protein product, partial [marine sediment metagenome]
MKPVAHRVREIQPSKTVEIAALAQQMKAQGENVISLSVGEPDFSTPSHVRKAAEEAIRAGLTRYGPATGSPSLLAAVRAKFSNENNLSYNEDQI